MVWLPGKVAAEVVVISSVFYGLSLSIGRFSPLSPIKESSNSSARCWSPSLLTPNKLLGLLSGHPPAPPQTHTPPVSPTQAQWNFHAPVAEHVFLLLCLATCCAPAWTPFRCFTPVCRGRLFVHLYPIQNYFFLCVPQTICMNIRTGMDHIVWKACVTRLSPPLCCEYFEGKHYALLVPIYYIGHRRE